MSAANWGILGGGGAKYFFSGPKRPPSHYNLASAGSCINRATISKVVVIDCALI